MSRSSGSTPAIIAAKSLNSSKLSFLIKWNVLEHLRTVFVQRSVNGEGWTSGEPFEVLDIIENHFHFPRKALLNLKDLYLNDGMTASQIAENFGISKQAVLARLRQQGVRRTTGQGRRSENFRYPYPPFGFRKIKGALVPFKREIKIARIVVELRDRRRLKWAEIVRHLNESGLKARKNKCWTSVAVRRIHIRWTGKV